MRRPFVALAACALAVAAAGCGNRPAKARNPAPSAPRQQVTLKYPAAGVTFRAPRNWALSDGRPPSVATLASGPATVAIWRYPRTKLERLPRKPVELQGARLELIAAARKRDPTLVVRSSRPVVVNGVPGIELLAVETIAGVRRSVRSTHLYAHRGEVVVDAFAPPGEFARVDRLVFGPLTQSLRLAQPARR